MPKERIIHDDTIAAIKEKSYQAGKDSCKWFTQQRQDWIHELIHIYGFMKRDFLIKKFGIGSATATRDFALYMKRRPDTIYYNPRIKQYEVFHNE